MSFGKLIAAPLPTEGPRGGGDPRHQGNTAVQATFAGMACDGAGEGRFITTGTSIEPARELARSRSVRLRSVVTGWPTGLEGLGQVEQPKGKRYGD